MKFNLEWKGKGMNVSQHMFLMVVPTTWLYASLSLPTFRKSLKCNGTFKEFDRIVNHCCEVTRGERNHRVVHGHTTLDP